MSERRVRCPKCGATDDLVLRECHEEIGETDAGVIYRDDRGLPIPPSVFTFEPGHALWVQVWCTQCDHIWRPRPNVISTETRYTR